MATATSYDKWDDPGMAFTEEEIKGYSPQVFASGRIDELVHLYQMVNLVQSGAVRINKPVFWNKAGRKLLDKASWYAQALEVPGIDREAVEVLPEPDSVEGKELMVAARELARMEPDEWLESYWQECSSMMFRVVTLGRRCSTNPALSGWGKRDRSYSNKLANAVNNELLLVGKLKEILETNTK